MRYGMALLLLLPICALPAHATRFWVSTAGSDTNAGSFDAPFATIAKAVSLPPAVFKPGDTITVRGGTYVTTATIKISANGAVNAPCHLLAFPGERAVLDCSSMAVTSSNRGITLSGSFWIVRGIDIRGAGDNGMYVTGSGNTIDWCTFSGNRDTGLQLSGGASNNRIVNCDSYGNADPGGGNADGFAPKLSVGTGNSFFGCRAWQNSDDGWDGYLRDSNNVTTTIEDCWCFMNGYLSDGRVSNGNGNGFKLGGSDTKDLMHDMILKRCIAFDNLVKGFDQNSNRGSMTLVNCTGYRNGVNYAMPDTLAYSRGKTLRLTNCVSLGPYGTLNGQAIQTTNSWIPPFAPASVQDFAGLDTAGVRGPRNADGSLPALPFLRLAAGSHLIDAGTDAGLAYSGTAPDLGAFEWTGPTDVRVDDPPVPADAELLQNYPNPFNGISNFEIRISNWGWVRTAVYDLLGREVARLVDGRMGPGAHSIRWDASELPSGVYLVVLRTENAEQIRRAILLR